MKQKHQDRTYVDKGKSWVGLDDEKEDHEYLISMAISKNDSPHISQVSTLSTTAILIFQCKSTLKIWVFKCLTHT